MPDNRKENPGLARFRIWVERDSVPMLSNLRDFFGMDASRVFGLGLHFLNVIALEKAQGRKIVSMNRDGSDIKDIY